MDDLKLALSSFDRKEGYKIYKAKKDAKGQAVEMTYENLFEVVDQFINSENQVKPAKTPKKEVNFGTKQVDLFTESENQIQDDDFEDIQYYEGNFNIGMSNDEDDEDYEDDLPILPDTGDSPTEEQC
jgi:hypothetical protein